MFTNKLGEGIKVPLCRINCGFEHVCIDLASSIDIDILISQHIFTIMPERGGVGRQVVNYKDVEVCMHAYSIYIYAIYLSLRRNTMKYIIRISDDLSETQRMTVWKKFKTARLTGANNRDSANISILKKTT